MQGWEIAQTLKASFGRKECLIPSAYKDSCDGKIIRAHTIPKSGSLKNISRDGHVYSFLTDDTAIGDPNKPLLKIGEVGVNRASTFTGFCSKHDREIFSDLENIPFVASEKQMFLLSYRANSREYFMKKSSQSMQSKTSEMDRGRELNDQVRIQSNFSAHNAGTDAGFSDANYFKEKLDNILLSGDFHKVRHLRVKLQGPPPLMAAGGILLEYDFNGEKLQNLGDLESLMHPIWCTSFYGGEYGEIVFTWLDESDAICSKFANSFVDLPSDVVTNALIAFLTNSFENIYFNPDWWDGLSKEAKQRIESNTYRMADYHYVVNSDYLSYDSVDYGQFKICGIEYNGCA